MRILFFVIIFFPVIARAQLILTDAKATNKTKKLYNNLRTQAARGIMFGHEDDLAYGVEWWNEKGRSDVKEVVGSYPAVYGWDIGKIGEDNNIDSVSFKSMRKWMKEAYKRGGINTISWHLDNLTSGGSSWDKTRTVEHILPGGKNHLAYLTKLDLAADYLKSIKSGFTKIPVIFRPFHEHNGSWFWWGKEHCTEEEYQKLWRFTVEYLRDEKKLHHLIYAYSPDASRLDMNDPHSAYHYGYPGDQYVDVIGLDDYWNVGRSNNPATPEEQESNFMRHLEMIDQLAKNKGKVAALTETGQSGLTNPNWFSEEILNPILKCEGINISYVLVWRNANAEHCFVPYTGHHAVDDFKKFQSNERVFFEKDLKNIYK